MSKSDKNQDLPFDLDLLIAANGKEMQNFYNLLPEERQRVLDKVIKTNEIIKNIKSSPE